MLKPNTPDALWKFCNWVLLHSLLVFLLLVTLFDNVALVVVAGVWAILLVAMAITYRIVRNVLVARGIPRSDLNAISKAIARAWAASFAIAIPIVLAIVYALNKFTTLLGVYDTFAYGLNFVTRFGIGLIILALPLYIGWLFWGKRVYLNQLDRLGVSDYQ